MIHYVYVGHFARQGDFINFQKQADGSLRPVLLRPLSMEVIQKILKEKGLTLASIPDEWGLWFDDGFMVCNRFSRRPVIDLVGRVAAETGCEIADYSSQSMMSLAEFAHNWEPQGQSEGVCIQEERADPLEVPAT